MSALTTTLKWLWVAWYTVPYLVFMRYWGKLTKGTWVNGRYVALADRLLGFDTTSGQAVGMVLCLDRKFVEENAGRQNDRTRHLHALYNHEYYHTRQALRWGPLWPFAYFGTIGWRWLLDRAGLREAYYRSRVRS